MEKLEIRPPAIRKRLNRWLPKCTRVMMSRISTAMQNFIAIGFGNFDPHPHMQICPPSVAYRVFTRLLFGVLTARYPKTVAPILTFSKSKDVSRKDVPFEGYETKLYILTPFSPKTQIFGRFSTRRIAAENGL